VLQRGGARPPHAGYRCAVSELVGYSEGVEGADYGKVVEIVEWGEGLHEAGGFGNGHIIGLISVKL